MTQSREIVCDNQDFGSSLTLRKEKQDRGARLPDQVLANLLTEEIKETEAVGNLAPGEQSLLNRFKAVAIIRAANPPRSKAVEDKRKGVIAAGFKLTNKIPEDSL
jgi:hypothetical protein